MSTRLQRGRHRNDQPESPQPDGAPTLPFSLAANPDLDTWLRVDAADTVTAFTGKVELGQGIVSAIARIAAEELDLQIDQVRVETADTAHGLDEMYTAGSVSIEHSGAAMRQAAAEARAHLVELASEVLALPVDELEVDAGTVHDSSGERSVTYWQLLGGGRFAQRASGRVAPKPPSAHRIVGKTAARRVDLRGLVTGETRFVSDLRHEQMAFGRVVRPPSPAARLVELDHAPVLEMSGVVAVVRDGSFIGVVADRESEAVAAADALRTRARWSEHETLPAGGIAAWLRDEPGQAFLVVDGVPGEAPPEPRPDVAWSHQASYSRPYLLHGSIGPSAAMALWEDEHLVVWSSSQGVYVLRAALAGALSLPIERIRVRHVVGAGAYGHNGADDAAFDASLLAIAVPGRAVLLQWSRSDEHQWEPYGAPALVDLRAVIDEEGCVAEWSHDVYGTTHVSRPMPGSSPNLLAGLHLEPPRAYDKPRPFLMGEAGIHRNATPIYDFPSQRIVKHFVAAMPLRTSSLRSLGAHANVFAIESFMDELAVRQETSPIEFRLRHLGDERARNVLQVAADTAGWSGNRGTVFGQGTGIAFARYKNSAGYAAVVIRLHVEDATALIVLDHITIVADCGEIVDPNGLINQLEGGALQAASWTLKEAVTFDDTAITSVDWDSYPILRFGEVPSIDTVLIDQPGQPWLGAGEIVQGPTAAAIANAVFDAIGFRLRDMPLTPAQVRRAAEVGESAWADSAVLRVSAFVIS